MVGLVDVSMLVGGDIMTVQDPFLDISAGSWIRKSFQIGEMVVEKRMWQSRANSTRALSVGSQPRY